MKLTDEIEVFCSFCEAENATEKIIGVSACSQCKLDYIRNPQSYESRIAEVM